MCSRVSVRVVVSNLEFIPKQVTWGVTIIVLTELSHVCVCVCTTTLADVRAPARLFVCVCVCYS